VLLCRLRAVTGSALAALAVAATPAVPAAAAGITPARETASVAPATTARPASRAAPSAPASTPGQQIAAALRTSPLYVDPSLNAAFPAAIRARLVQQISQAPAPVFILAVPLLAGGEWANGDQLATVVHDYLGRAGIYLTIDAELSTEIDAYTWPSDPYGTGAGPYYAADAALAANISRATRDAGLPQKFLACIELISARQAIPAYQAALRQLDVPQVAPRAQAGDGGPGPVLLIVLIVLIVIGVAVAAAGAGAWLLRRRAAQRSPEGLRLTFAAAVSEAAHRFLSRAGVTSQPADPGSHRRSP
jgi:hypothetical protein